MQFTIQSASRKPDVTKALLYCSFTEFRHISVNTTDCTLSDYHQDVMMVQRICHQSIRSNRTQSLAGRFDEPDPRQRKKHEALFR